MEDLGLTATLFEISSKLRKASTYLNKLAKDAKIDAQGKEVLEWTGQLLSAVDWSSKTPHRNAIAGGLAVRATSVRPTFYSSLIRIAPKLEKAGLNTESKVLDFLSLLYYNLLSPDGAMETHRRLNSTEFSLGALLLHEISESILVQLGSNGIPHLPSPLGNGSPTSNFEAVVAND